MIKKDNGVKFGDYHSFYDLGLIMTEPPFVSAPDVKTYTVDIPGANGAVDLSEALTGRPVYDVRSAEFTFWMMGPRSEWMYKYHTILNRIHGKKLKIIIDADADYYYTGRCSVSISGSTVKIAVEMTDPFKRKHELSKGTATAQTGTVEYRDSEISFAHIDVDTDTQHRIKLYTVESASVDIKRPKIKVRLNYDSAFGTLYGADATHAYQAIEVTDDSSGSMDLYFPPDTNVFTDIDLSQLTVLNADGFSGAYFTFYVAANLKISLPNRDPSGGVTVWTAGDCYAIVGGLYVELSAGTNVIDGATFNGEDSFLIVGAVSATAKYREAFL